MKIRQENHEDVELIRLDGRLDVHSTPFVLELLDDLVEDNVKKIILDMSDVKFISSYGLGTLVTTLKNIRGNGGTLKLASLRPEIKVPLEVTGLLSKFEVFNTSDEAINSFVS